VGNVASLVPVPQVLMATTTSLGLIDFGMLGMGR
jgi:hypothetical protein